MYKFKVIKDIDEIDAKIINPDFEGLPLRMSKYHYCNIEIKKNNKVNISINEYTYWRKPITKEEKEIIKMVSNNIEEILTFREKAFNDEEKKYRVNPRTEQVELYTIIKPFTWKCIGYANDGGRYLITPDEIQHDIRDISHVHQTYSETHNWIIAGWLLKNLFSLNGSTELQL